MRFDFRDLELFVAVAEVGSIARAAERTHTVASAVSKRLSELEAQFGTALLVRGAKGVTLTSAGYALLEKARALLYQADQLESELQQHASGTRGQVRVFANISSIVEFLPDALAGFLKLHPEVQVQLEERVSSTIAQAVADNRADLGIVSEQPVLDGLVTVPFRADELVLVTRSEHPLSQYAQLSFNQVLDHPFVGLHADSSLHLLLTRAAADAGKQINLRIQVTSFDAVCAMVSAGLGISIVPRAATTPYVQSLKLVSIPLSNDWAQRELLLCTRKGELHAAARLLLEHLRLPQ
ncbi:MAG: LysR family transcriptional regulator [Steroidobacteraceae bacterium]